MIEQRDLVAMNEEIWASMLGMTLSCVESGETPTHGSGFIGACVQLVGAWQGAVRVDCTLVLARRAAARFLGIHDCDLTLEEVRDAVGELANMVAGSVKALVSTPTHISLPSVADGSDYDFTVRKGRLLLQCPFECEGERLLLSLFESDPAPEEPKRPLTEWVQ